MCWLFPESSQWHRPAFPAAQSMNSPHESWPTSPREVSLHPFPWQSSRVCVCVGGGVVAATASSLGEGSMFHQETSFSGIFPGEGGMSDGCGRGRGRCVKRSRWRFQKGTWHLGVPGLSLGQNATDGPPEFGQGSHVRPVTGNNEGRQDHQVSSASECQLRALEDGTQGRFWGSRIWK